MTDGDADRTDRPVGGGSGYCQHGSTGPCPDCDVICQRCEDRPADPEIAPRTDHDLCQQCVREIMRESARGGERGKGQRPIGEENAWMRSAKCQGGDAR